MTGMAGNCSKWPEIVRVTDHYWKLLDRAGMAGNCQILLKMFVNGRKYLEMVGMVGYVWKWLQTAKNCWNVWEMLEMPGNG